MKTLAEVELTRHNVTPAQFLAYVRATIKKKGLQEYASDLSLDYFTRGYDLNFYYHDDQKKPCKAEKSVSHPYEMQTYILNWDGSCYNEICEFEFDDEKTGHGYYYLLNTEADTTDTTKGENTIIETIKQELTTRNDCSAWSKGVTAYALELVEDLEEAIDGGYFDIADLEAPEQVEHALLNGASDWNQYSWGGSSLIYDSDITGRLCCPSEIKRSRNGKRKPNSREEWLDVQARALFQACNRVKRAVRAALKA